MIRPKPCDTCWRGVLDRAPESRVIERDYNGFRGQLRRHASCGLWPDFSRIDRVHRLESTARPAPARVAVYRQLLPLFDQARASTTRRGR